MSEDRNIFYVSRADEAKRLIYRGFVVCDIQPSKFNHSMTEFGFENTLELQKAYFEVVEDARQARFKKRETKEI